MPSYQLKVCDDNENLIALIDNASISSLDWVVSENEVGVLSVRLPQAWSWETFSPFRTLILERQLEGGGYSIVENRRWFLFDVAFGEEADGPKYCDLVAYDQNVLLEGRVVAYAEGTSEADKVDNYDDVCKLIVTENIVSPTDTGRTITGITVAAGTGSAPSATHKLTYKNLLQICQDMANASAEEGTYLVFDLVNTGAGTYEMRTYTGQHGVDHTADSGDPRVITLRSPRLECYWTGSADVVYAGKPVQEVEATNYIAFSRFARREKFVSGSNETEAASLAQAHAEVQRSRPRLILTGQILQTEGMQYGLDFGWGDMVTAEYAGFSMDAHITRVHGMYDAGKEDIEVLIRGEL